MRSQNLTRSIHRSWPVVLASSAAISATQAQAADWTKHFRVGMQITLNIEADISSGGIFDLQTRPGEYDDGHVRRDATPNPDQTTNFRFENDDQVDAAGPGTLVYHRADSFSTEFSETSRDDSPYLGLELAYGTAITRWGDAIIGWEAGYSFLPISIKDRRNLRGQLERGSYIYTYPDNVTLPPAPYTGPASGQSANVINTDFTRGASQFLDGVARGSRGLDVSLHTLRVGPTIHFELARRWAVQGGLGPMVGYVTGDYTFNEEFAQAGAPTQRAEGDFGGDDFVYGGYAQALLLFHFEEHGDIYAGLQFMSLSGTEFEEGDRRAKLDMGATLSFLVGVNWPF